MTTDAGRPTETPGALEAAEIEPHPGRAALAMAAMLTLGTSWYWAYRGQNAVDWDDPNLRARVSGEAWCMDNNGIAMNFLAHPFSGSAFYAVARANHLGVATSSLYSFTTSFIWEYVIEFREKVSINDVVVTPGAGIAMGEFFHKLGLYVNGALTQTTPAASALRYATGPTVAIDRAIDDAPALAEPPPHADFALSYRFASAERHGSASLNRHELGFTGTLVSIPGYGQLGSFDRGLTNADITELSVAASHSSEGNGLDLAADTLLLGYYAQDQQATSTRRAMIGTSIAYRFLDSHAAGVPERLGVLHLPGLAADVHLAAGGLSLELRARAHPDFAGVGSLAYPQWRAAFPDERPKSILLKKGYYYGLGGSGRLNAQVGWGPLALRAEAEAALYDSVEGFDRAKELVTVDVPASDRIRNTRFELLLLPLPWLTLSAGIEQRRVVSKAGGFRTTSNIVERGFGVSVGF